jgi:hypothetical protein
VGDWIDNIDYFRDRASGIINFWQLN